MDNLIKSIEKDLFSKEDTVCLERAMLATEAHKKYSNQPAPLLRALTFKHILDNMTLDLESNSVFAGNVSSGLRKWVLFPEFGFTARNQIEFENPKLKNFLDGKIPVEIRQYWADKSFGGDSGIGHLSIDFDLVVNQGLEAILKRIEKDKNQGFKENIQYREAMAITCSAVINWTGRYAEATANAASNCPDPEIRQCLNRTAEACRHVPAKPARNLFEGLQAIILVHLATVIEGHGYSISIGRPDRILANFNSEVKERPEQAVNFIRAFLLKIAANPVWGSGSKTQAITIGGAAADENNFVETTRAFLDAFDKTPVNDPQLFLRWNREINPENMRKSMEMLTQGRSMPMLVNDHEIIPGLLDAGVTEKHAGNYCIIGCNELGIPGHCCQSAFSLGMGFDELKVLDMVIRGISTNDITTEQILDSYEAQVHERIEIGLKKRMEKIERHTEDMPFPFTSACCHGCVESGMDLLKGMTYSNIYGVFIRGTANAINALAVVDFLVVKHHKLKLSELIEGVDKQDSKVLNLISSVPRWGNDNDYVDDLGVELNKCRDRALRKVASDAGLPPFALCHVVRSLHHIDGAGIGHTLDGRKAGHPVGDSIGAIVGTQLKGPTSLLNSVLKLNASHWFSGIYNLNLTLQLGQFGSDILTSTVSTFFKAGGQELQINALDANMLRKARNLPEQYPDLIVRIAGLNARFIDLSPLEQDEIITRAEQATSPP